MSRVKGWLDVLRSLGKDAGSEAHELVEAEAQLWHAHEKSTASATQVVEATGGLAAASGRQRKLVDTLLETARTAQARADEIGPALVRVTETLERLRLVALNVGLEGSRMGDAAGRSLTMVSDEVRTYVERGVEALHDTRALVEEVGPTAGHVAEHAEALRQSEADLGGEILRVQSLAQETSRSVEEIGRWARKLSETDPETATILARAAEHARGLVSDLSLLKSATQTELARAVLRPIIEPLVRLLRDLGGDAH
ncbi:MAG: hypothetical protein HY898_35770 [Deltaproteobacteria bacterium]|nr:hypothetical protein [Deltaproteobacteria bacterium]